MQQMQSQTQAQEGLVQQPVAAHVNAQQAHAPQAPQQQVRQARQKQGWKVVRAIKVASNTRLRWIKRSLKLLKKSPKATQTDVVN